MWKCIKCNKVHKKYIFEFNDYSYCIASNEEEPEFEEMAQDNKKLKWFSDFGDAKIGEPVGCLVCKTRDTNNFEIV